MEEGSLTSDSLGGCTVHSSFSKLLATLQMGVHNQNEGKESQKQIGKQAMKIEENMN